MRFMTTTKQHKNKIKKIGIQEKQQKYFFKNVPKYLIFFTSIAVL